MEDVKRILVVSRDTQYDRKAVHYGFSLAGQYGAKLYVIHTIHNPFSLQGWNLPIPSREKEYKRLLRDTRNEIAAMINSERKKGIKVKHLVKEGDPQKEIRRTYKPESTSRSSMALSVKSI